MVADFSRVDNLKPFLGFDPTWSFEKAKENANPEAKYFCPLSRWQVWRQLNGDYKTSYEAGNHDYLLLAMGICAEFFLPMPKWVADAFQASFSKWRRYEIKSLDDAFNVKRPKGLRAGAISKKMKLWPEVFWRVSELRETKTVDDEFYASVGEEFNISGSTARDLYRFGCEQTGLGPPEPKDNSPRSNTKIKKGRGSKSAPDKGFKNTRTKK